MTVTGIDHVQVGAPSGAGHEPETDRETIPGSERAYVHDPFGNRLELRQG